MKSKAVRLYGKRDIRLEEFELPALAEDQILAQVVSNSICMSSHKAAEQGADHKRVPADIARNPIILGHEFSGIILEVGSKWQQQFRAGEKFSIQPALNYRGSPAAPGYSYPYTGGNATCIIIPNEVMECGCLLSYRGPGFFPASLSEPLSCIVGAFRASYHTTPGSYEHQMGIKPGGAMALLAGAGPMGLEAVDYALHTRPRPSLLVVTDLDEQRLTRARSLFPPAPALQQGVTLHYLASGGLSPAETHRQLLALSGSSGFDDVFIFAPAAPLVALGDSLLKPHGCLNFFAGPTTADFSAPVNFYNVHYSGTHLAGTSGGNTEDMRIALAMMEQEQITPAVMLTHIGGLDAAGPAILNLPAIPGGKKLIYTHLQLELTAIADFEKLQHTRPLFKELYRITAEHNGLWCVAAEEYLLSRAGSQAGG